MTLGTLIEDEETDWTRPPFARPPPPLEDPVAPNPDDDELALMAPILDHGLGGVVEALTAAGRAPAVIVETLKRDHGVLVAPAAVGRYMIHVQVVRRARKLGNRPAHPELDAAIRGRHEELAAEAPEDLKRIDKAIGFLDKVVDGDKAIIGEANANIVLRERVKAAEKVVQAVGSKYEITKRKLLPEEGGDKQADLVAILQAAYGPAVQLQPKAIEEDPLGLLGKPRS